MNGSSSLGRYVFGSATDANAFIALTLSITPPLAHDAYRQGQESRQQRSRERDPTKLTRVAGVTFLHHRRGEGRCFLNDFARLGGVSTKIRLGQFNRGAQVDLLQQAVEPWIGVDRPFLAQGPGQALQGPLPALT